MKRLLIAAVLAAASTTMGVTAQAKAPISGAALVQQQVAAYNRHDLDAFVDAYSEDVTIYRMQRAATQSSISGKAALREFYRTERFNRPGLRAQILHRTVLGNKIVDHERIFGLGAHPLEAVVVYAIEQQHIAAVWIFSPE